MGPVRMNHSEGVGEGVFLFDILVIVRVVDLGIDHRLNGGILCGINLQTAAVYELLRLLFGIAGVYKVALYIFYKTVDKVRVNCFLIIVLINIIVFGDTGINIVGQSLFFLGGRDISLPFHVSQNL